MEISHHLSVIAMSFVMSNIMYMSADESYATTCILLLFATCVDIVVGVYNVGFGNLVRWACGKLTGFNDMPSNVCHEALCHSKRQKEHEQYGMPFYCRVFGTVSFDSVSFQEMELALHTVWGTASGGENGTVWGKALGTRIVWLSKKP